MTSPHLRRLANDYAGMLDLVGSSELISFHSLGSPPSKYIVKMSCLGLVQVKDVLLRSSEHEFDLLLSENFPKLPPRVVWKTAIFHPNFKPPDVCMGDIWYPGLSLAELCVALCELVQYKSFNIYDPLDTQAAFWLWEELSRDESIVPIDGRPVVNPQFEITASPRHDPVEE
ncbi:ubiquitin-conjugating enzyme E2 [Streptomyces sp. NPDC008137]|uniref:ubiquitin-conjugating enzyme E2 n=1 Tax=Streptomyces sp. NPDC008137 TaxID=3364813 RepID=UPI0036E77579